MMRLDTELMTPASRTGRRSGDELPLLIQVPRVQVPPGRGPTWYPEPSASRRAPGRPRRRLRRGVRRLAGSMLVLAAMAGTFAVGWTTRGAGDSRLPLLRAVVPASKSGVDQPSEAPLPAVADRGDDDATAPALGAPVADAEVPVVFPGYLLPDNNREEPAHEGS